MGKIIIAELKGFEGTVNLSGAGKMCAHSIPVLIFRQNVVYGYCDDFSVFVTEAESYGGDFSVCVSAGDHLYRNINT